MTKHNLSALRSRRLAYHLLAIVAGLVIAAQVEAAVFAYVPNQSGASVAVVDVGNGAVITTVPVGVAPIGVAVAPGGRFVYVAQHNSDAVAVISTNTNTVQAQISTGSKPVGVAVSPDGTRLYVTNSLTATASGGGSLWIKGTLTVVDAVTRDALVAVIVGANPTGVAVSPDGSRVYVANAGSGTLSVISAASNTVTATIPVGANPVGVAASPDGLRVYVANGGSASVSVIDAAALTVTSTIRVGGHAMGVAVSDDSTRVLVSNTFDNSVSVIDAATQAVFATTTTGIGQSPAGVAFVPGGRTGLVANSRSATVSSVNATSGAAVVLSGSTLGWPVSLGKFVAVTPSCALDVSGDAVVSSTSDGVLILRYLLGFRGAALTQGVSGIGAGVNAATIELTISGLNLDADGDGAMLPTTDGLLLVRALLHLTDNALISGARNTGYAGVRSAAQVLQWITNTHGASCLL